MNVQGNLKKPVDAVMKMSQEVNHQEAWAIIRCRSFFQELNYFRKKSFAFRK